LLLSNRGEPSTEIIFIYFLSVDGLAVLGVKKRGDYFFLVAAFLAGVAGVVKINSVSVDSPAREGPVLPNEDEPREVRMDRAAAEPATLSDAPISTATQPAASVPVSARNDCTNVLIARSSVAVKYFLSNIFVSPKGRDGRFSIRHQISRYDGKRFSVSRYESATFYKEEPTKN
jgi:hypothetical protein